MSGGVATLTRVVRGGLTEMVTLEPRLEGDERVSLEVIWRRYCYEKAMRSWAGLECLRNREEAKVAETK